MEHSVHPKLIEKSIEIARRHCINHEWPEDDWFELSPHFDLNLFIDLTDGQRGASIYYVNNNGDTKTGDFLSLDIFHRYQLGVEDKYWWFCTKCSKIWQRDGKIFADDDSLCVASELLKKKS